MARELSDTHPEAEAILRWLYRETPAWRKWELMCQLNEMVQELALQGIRERNPDASEPQIQRMFAEMILGKELAAKVYESAPDRVGCVQLNEIIAVLRQFVDVLEELDIPYVVGGSLAKTAHASYRATNDADVLVDMTSEHVETIAAALGRDFYADPDMMRDAIQRRSSFNIIHYPTMLKIDVFIPKARNFDRGQFEHRVIRPLPQGDPEAEDFYVASAEDTVLAKLDWYRMGNEVSDRQWSDIMDIIKTQGERLDLGYMRRVAAELGVSDLLEKAFSEAS